MIHTAAATLSNSVESMAAKAAKPKERKPLKQQEVYEKYVKHVEAYCGWQKVDGQNPDEEFMRAIESNIGISNQAKKAFREEMLIRISAYRRKGRVFDYTSHERLREGIEKYIVSTESA